VLPGDQIDDASGTRTRLSSSEQAMLVHDATLALQRMIDITEAGMG
jgi:hypothetical protein